MRFLIKQNVLDFSMKMYILIDENVLSLDDSSSNFRVDGKKSL